MSSDIAWLILDDEESVKYSVGAILNHASKFKNLNLELIRAFLIANGMHGYVFDEYQRFGMTFAEAIRFALDAKAYVALLDMVAARSERNLSKSSISILNEVQKLLKEEDRWDIVMEYRYLFSDIPAGEVIKNYLRLFGIGEFARRIPDFQEIDNETAHALERSGHIRAIGKNLDRFQ